MFLEEMHSGRSSPGAINTAFAWQTGQRKADRSGLELFSSVFDVGAREFGSIRNVSENACA